MKNMTICLDGKMVQARAELVDALTPGVVQGRGVFETMRVCNGKIFTLEEHFDRLNKGLRRLKIRSPYSKKRLSQYLRQTIQANRFAGARIRLAIWREGRRTRMAIVYQESGQYSDDQYQKGFRAILSKIKRNKTKYSDIKSLDYACFRRAFGEAQERGCDEAILLNNRKEMVEGSRTNIFFVKGGALYTPAVRCGCLNGITRQIVMRSARRMGIPCKAVAADVRRLFNADEAFVTNSLIGIMPLTVAQGRRIGHGKAGPVTQKLLRAYHTNLHPSSP